MCRVTQTRTGEARRGFCMHMRRISLILGIALALTPLVAAGTADSRKRPGCRPAHTQTVVQDAHTRVFRRRIAPGAYNYDYFVCRFGSGRVIRLLRAGYLHRVSKWRLAGRYVAWLQAETLETGDIVTTILVYDATRRRRRMAVGGQPDPDLLLTRSGSVAWLDPRYQGPQRAVEVRTLDGRSLTLDRGPGLKPGSLALAGSLLYWTHGGEPRSAPIP